MSSPGRKKRVCDKEILQAVALHPDPVVTPSEVAEYVDMTRQGVNKRLRDLSEDGYLVRKEVGGRAVIYWPDDAGREKAAEA
jgi:predicted transcriptional regulator